MSLTSNLRLASVLLVAIAMAAGFAHLFELPHKIGMTAEEYLTVQQIYRGWALLGIAIIGALVTLSIVAIRIRHDREPFALTLAAAGCIALSLVVFFVFTFPVNQATQNWTMLPADWQDLRRRWEYSHAINAGLYFIALVLVTLSLLVGTRPAETWSAENQLADQERRRGTTTPRSSAARTASS